MLGCQNCISVNITIYLRLLTIAIIFFIVCAREYKLIKCHVSNNKQFYFSINKYINYIKPHSKFRSKDHHDGQCSYTQSRKYRPEAAQMPGALVSGHCYHPCLGQRPNRTVISHNLWQTVPGSHCAV